MLIKAVYKYQMPAALCPEGSQTKNITLCSPVVVNKFLVRQMYQSQSSIM